MGRDVAATTRPGNQRSKFAETTGARLRYTDEVVRDIEQSVFQRQPSNKVLIAESRDDDRCPTGANTSNFVRRRGNSAETRRGAARGGGADIKPREMLSVPDMPRRDASRRRRGYSAERPVDVSDDGTRRNEVHET